MPYADLTRKREVAMAWNRNNPESRKRHQRRYGRNVKTKALAMLGGQCVVCGESDPRLLIINHKNGNGHKERANGASPGAAIYRMINSGQRSLEDLDVRCYNHNILYEYETGRRHWDGASASDRNYAGG